MRDSPGNPKSETAQLNVGWRYILLQKVCAYQLFTSVSPGSQPPLSIHILEGYQNRHWNKRNDMLTFIMTKNTTCRWRCSPARHPPSTALLLQKRQ